MMQKYILNMQNLRILRRSCESGHYTLLNSGAKIHHCGGQMQIFLQV